MHKFRHLLITFGTVSYTHLDVYKRQAKDGAAKQEYAPRVISGELAFLIRSALNTAISVSYTHLAASVGLKIPQRTPNSFRLSSVIVTIRASMTICSMRCV